MKYLHEAILHINTPPDTMSGGSPVPCITLRVDGQINVRCIAILVWRCAEVFLGIVMSLPPSKFFISRSTET